MITTTKFKGNEVKLNGTIPSLNTKAPDFTYVKSDLSEANLYASKSKVKVIIALPSLDTGVCQMETRAFNTKLSDLNNVEGIVVSKDLPFAMKRFCETEGIKNVISASDFRGNFTDNYKTLMIDGPLKGLSARIVFVLDEQNTIKLIDIASDITAEPNYDLILASIRNLLS
jgi:thioredoxin-dependent peroxiredoxin